MVPNDPVVETVSPLLFALTLATPPWTLNVPFSSLSRISPAGSPPSVVLLPLIFRLRVSPSPALLLRMSTTRPPAVLLVMMLFRMVACRTEVVPEAAVPPILAMSNVTPTLPLLLELMAVLP